MLSKAEFLWELETPMVILHATSILPLCYHCVLWKPTENLKTSLFQKLPLQNEAGHLQADGSAWQCPVSLELFVPYDLT